MAGKNLVIRPRFYVFFFVFLGLIVGLILWFTRDTNVGEVRYGDVSTELTASSVIVREESTVSTEKYQKITFSVVEGDAVTNGQEIARVYKRGFPEETLVSQQRVERDILDRQRMLITDTEAEEGYRDIEERIETLGEAVRESARNGSGDDMLALENELKELQWERRMYLDGSVTPDAELEALYAERDGLDATIAEWERGIVNSAGNGTVSFYFDGYERVINASQLSMINSALINSVVKGGNTASTSTGDSSAEKTLYRLVNTAKWYIAFVTKADAPFRTVKGERYDVTFPDYSDKVYHATAADPTVTGGAVVNFLEFDTEIGEFLNIRSVSAVIQKSASGTMVPADMIGYLNGEPYLMVLYGKEAVTVPVNIYCADETNAVVEPKDRKMSLSAGVKIQRPPEPEEDEES